MIIEVELAMFQDGDIRNVEIPDGEIVDDLEIVLDRVFFYGQNDVQPDPERCSVSAGDIVRYKGERYLIRPIGFRKLAPGEMMPKDPVERIRKVYEKESKKGKGRKKKENEHHGN